MSTFVDENSTKDTKPILACNLGMTVPNNSCSFSLRAMIPIAYKELNIGSVPIFGEVSFEDIKNEEYKNFLLVFQIGVLNVAFPFHLDNCKTELKEIVTDEGTIYTIDDTPIDKYSLREGCDGKKYDLNTFEEIADKISKEEDFVVKFGNVMIKNDGIEYYRSNYLDETNVLVRYNYDTEESKQQIVDLFNNIHREIDLNVLSLIPK